MRLNYPRRFTLIELLLVVFILAAIAATAVSLTSQVDEQFRYEDTKTRRQQIREAILGDPSRTANGQAVISGFAADTGGLPTSLRQLMELSTPPVVPSWTYFEDQNQWAGWRGPYLHGTEGRDPYAPAERRLYYLDGWANVAAKEDYPSEAEATQADFLNGGWLWGSPGDPWPWDLPTETVPFGELWLRSVGADGRLGTSELGAGGLLGVDTPADRLLIRDADHRVDLRGWRVRVRISGTSTSAIPELRVIVWVPAVASNGAVTWPTNNPALISDPLTPGDVSGEWVGVFEFPDTGGPRWAAWGRRSIDLFDASTGSRWDIASNSAATGFTAREVTLLPRTVLPDLATQPALDISLDAP